MTIEIGKRQIQLVAEVLKKMPESGKGLNFYSFNTNGVETFASELYPPINYPHALNFFFFTVMHDFGFRYGDDKGYLMPLYGTINGKETKGSDLLWKVLTRKLLMETLQFEPAFLADILPKEFARIFSDDNGPIIWPDFEKRFKMTRAYGRWFMEEKISPSEILILVNQEEEPLKEFLWWTRRIPGYDRDSFFHKKNLLLAMILANRPEKFLKVKDPQNWKPIIDYHLMRLALRLGLVELEKIDQKKNKKREWVNVFIELEIRRAVYEAICELIEKSGRSMSFVDEKMWMGRKYCPEMITPECDKCVFKSVCKKRVALFQPVFRTTSY